MNPKKKKKKPFPLVNLLNFLLGLGLTQHWIRHDKTTKKNLVQLKYFFFGQT